MIEKLEKEYGRIAASKLIAYMDGVLEQNEHINLTAIRDRDDFYVKHILDSLSSAKMPEFNGAGHIIDVGTGGGFPGIPLAIIAPDKDFVLLDSTAKKLKVIDSLAKNLDIENITTIHARAEEINATPPHYESYDLCVTRAVSDLSKLAKWCLPFVKAGGSLIAYKGGKAYEEIEGAESELYKNKGEISRVEHIELPDAESHNLVVVHKM